MEDIKCLHENQSENKFSDMDYHDWNYVDIVFTYCTDCKQALNVELY